MGHGITYATELAVGIASFALGVVVWRSRRRRWLAAVFLVAGVVASVHALAELVA